MVIVSLTALAILIFFMSGQVGFFTTRYTLKAYFSSAGDLREGAAVRLAGIAVGNVSRIQISPYSDPQRAVEIDMKIAKRYQNEIRADSEATLNTVGLLGDSYVDITRGTPSSEAVREGGAVKSREEKDIRAIVQNTNDVIENLRGLSEKLNDITTQIQSGKGAIGGLIYDEALYNRMNTISTTLQAMVNRVDRGEGSLGKLVSDDTLYNHSVATLDRLDKVIDETEHGSGSLAKFISDPSAYNNLDKLLSEGHTFVDNINNGQGSLGKLAKDEQLYKRMNETFDHLNTIAARVDQGQGTLGKLSTDASLFNTLNETAQSLKEFLADFRKNPKKYLSIKMHIF